jgi:hypothetical protein
MTAAEDAAFFFNPVSYHFTPAMFTFGGQFMNRAFKGIENVSLASFMNFKRTGIIISADFTYGHYFTSSEYFKIT